MSKYRFPLWTYLACLLFAGVFTQAPGAARAAELFTELPAAAAAQPNSLEARRLAPLSQRRTTRALRLVRVNPAALAGTSVEVTLPEAGQRRLTRRRELRRSRRDYTWVGDVRGGGQAVLVVRDGQITGFIQSGTEQFTVTPLGNGTHALVKLDPSRFPADHPPGYREPPAPRSERRDEHPGIAEAPGDPVGIDILVPYTTAARQRDPNIATTAQLAVDATNVAYANSGIDIVLRLVGTMEIGFSETGQSFDSMLGALAAGTSPQMAAVHARREQTGADAVQLLTGLTAYCGMAYLHSSAGSAFGVVSTDCAVGNQSFAHELGHNFGARHDPHVDGGNTPFAYGHGYVAPSKAWRTVMSYANECGGCPRIQHFSNPGVSYNGVPTGTAAVHDNARVHRERAGALAAFRTPPVAAHDNFVDAATIVLDLPVKGSNYTGTPETGEPVHSAGAGGSRSGGASPPPAAWCTSSRRTAALSIRCLPSTPAAPSMRSPWLGPTTTSAPAPAAKWPSAPRPA